ncbi:MAG: class I SAM-dependent methyltransferase [Candidatus Obscuribacterales bacterium]|nr:class I SAM-dependent methyltransferase [Candidatus Obscuribacterales bacterium]
MNAVIYPLGHAEKELERLDGQASLLCDPSLEALFAHCKSCLEIGCGNGANLPLLRQQNRYTQYTGIDTSEAAIDEAFRRFHDSEDTRFMVMSGASIDLPDSSFDLIFTKLVLWSVGVDWPCVLEEAMRLLKPGGTFYAFEPCNHLVEMYPSKPSARRWMNQWDEAACASGLDPFIGPKVASQLNAAGFENVDSKFFPVIATGREKERYEAIVGNLKCFYMGPSAEALGLPSDGELRRHATAEFLEFGPESLVMDAFFVSRGSKSS